MNVVLDFFFLQNILVYWQFLLNVFLSFEIERTSQSITLLLGWANSPFACRSAQFDRLTAPLWSRFSNLYKSKPWGAHLLLIILNSHSKQILGEISIRFFFRNSKFCLCANLLRIFFSFCIVRNMIIFRENVLSLWGQLPQNLISSSIVTQKNIRWD